MLRHVKTYASGAFLALCSLSLPGIAQVVESVDNILNVSLLDGWREQSGAHYAGIQINLAPGWKTYWRAPGDGGIPTTANWSGSENLEYAKIFWPRPQVFRQHGLRSVGYADRVILPVHLVAGSDDPIDVRLSLRLGVCKEICLPVDVSLTKELSARDAKGVEPIKAALSSQPAILDATLTCALRQTENGYQLSVATTLPELKGAAETAVVELSNSAIWVSEPAFERTGSKVTSVVQLVRHSTDAKINLNTLRMTVLTTQAAVELQGCD